MDLKSRLLQENEFSGFPQNETMGSKVKNGLKNNWGKLLGGAAAGAGAYMLGDHFSDDLHNFNQDMHDTASKGAGNYWNSWMDTAKKGLNNLKVDHHNIGDNKGAEIWKSTWNGENSTPSGTSNTANFAKTTGDNMADFAKASSEKAAENTSHPDNESLDFLKKQLASAKSEAAFQKIMRSAPTVDRDVLEDQLQDSNAISKKVFDIEKRFLRDDIIRPRFHDYEITDDMARDKESEILNQKYNEWYAAQTKKAEEHKAAAAALQKAMTSANADGQIDQDEASKIQDLMNKFKSTTPETNFGGADKIGGEVPQTAIEALKSGLGLDKGTSMGIDDLNTIKHELKYDLTKDLRDSINYAKEHGLGFMLLDKYQDQAAQILSQMKASNALPSELEPLYYKLVDESAPTKIVAQNPSGNNSEPVSPASFGGIVGLPAIASLFK